MKRRIQGYSLTRAAKAAFLQDSFLNRDRIRPEKEGWEFQNAFRIRNEADRPDTTFIDILDEISFWGVNAKDVRDQLAGIQSSHIEVTINSPGGDVFDGFMIFNELANHPAEVTTIISGEAASIASVIAKAGDHRVIFKNSRDMIHNPWCICLGEAKDFLAMASLLDSIKEDVVDIYAGSSNLSAKEISQLMDDETWFTAAQALKNGLVHEVIDPKQSSSEAPASEHETTPVCSKVNGADEEQHQYETRQREIDLLAAI